MITINDYKIAGRMPIFTAENRDLIRRNIKTQTRRVIKFPEHTYQPDAAWVASVNPDGKDGWVAWGPSPVTDEQSRAMYPNGGGFKCSYGAVGDIRVMPEPLEIGFAGNVVYAEKDSDGLHSFVKINGQLVKWRWQRDTLSSMFMPTWAGRTLVRCIDIRVERLHDISEADAKAEGCHPGSLEGPCMIAKWDARSAYELLWDSINSKKHPWSDNPWVWVIEWKLLK